MSDREPRAGLFPALLKHWRGQRGLSQLDLALAADVSSRHISFLETGRSAPSADMVRRLALSLGVPLRHVDAMLQAAGHPAAFGASGEALPQAVVDALVRLKAHHEPFPLIVVDRRYRIVDLNQGAERMLAAVLGSASRPRGANLARITLDPAGAQPFLVNFDELGRQLLWRIQREVLAEPEDTALRGLLDELLAMPTVPDDWRQVDWSEPSEPALVVHLRRGDLELRFLTMVTAFQAPQHPTVDELRIETWLPYDPVTAEACHRYSAGGHGR